MKNLLMIIAILMSVLAAATAVHALSIPQMDVLIMNQDPDPVGPASYVDVRFKLENHGTTSAKDVTLELLPGYPFSLDPGDNAVKNVGIVPAAGSSNDVVIVKYRVRVDKNAVEGTNKLSLRYRIGTGDWITEQYDMNIRTQDPTLTIQSVSTSPEKIKPGEPATISINVMNTGDSDITNINLKLDLTYSTLLGQTADPATVYATAPFAPIHSATEKKIKLLSRGENHTFSYDVIANSDTKSMVYKIPVQLTFYDSQGHSYTKNDVIGLTVGGAPELDAVIDSTEITQAQPSGKVILKFINKGTTDVKFLNVKLNPSSDYSIMSANEVYVGSVDSDDYQTADFKLYVKQSGNKTALRQISLPVTITYKDPNGAPYSREEVLAMPLYTAQELGIGGGNGFMLIIGIIILGVVGWFVYKRTSRRKN